MRTRPTILASLAFAALAVSACGRSEAVRSSSPAAPAAAEASATTSGAAPAAVATTTVGAKAATSKLGTILVDAQGHALYGFTNDVDARSSCSNKCAEAWPPVIVPADWDVGPGLDTGIFATTTREDGQLQLVAGKWPLYTFAGDAAPGDLNGQGSGDVWFVVDAKGALVKGQSAAPAAGAATGGGYGTPAASTSATSAAPAAGATTTAAQAAEAPVGTASSELGTVLVDDDGLTLYGFTKDSAGTPTCAGACAQAWPPLLVPSAAVPAGLDPKVFTVVTRADGTHQLKAGKWPLYTFAGDAAPGDVNGQGSAGVWFAVNPAGGLIK